MKTKLPLCLAAVVVAALAAAAAPVYADCSGDDCGCGIAEMNCEASCPTGEFRPACISECIHLEVCCAEACCGGCNPACGCNPKPASATLTSGSLLRSPLATSQASSKMDFRTWEARQTGTSCNVPEPGR